MREARARQHAGTRHAGAARCAISWPSRPLPASKPLHSHSTPGAVGRAQRRACRAGPAIGVAIDQQAARARAPAPRRDRRSIASAGGSATPAGSAALRARRAHLRACCASRAHSSTSWRGAALHRERGAPGAGAEDGDVHAMTAARAGAGRLRPIRPLAMMRESPLPLPGCRQLLLLGLEHGLEVHFGQQHRREAGAGADVGDDGAQVRVDDLRAGDAEDRLHLLVGQVADLEDAGLLGLDQEQRRVADLGGDGGGDGDLEDAVGDRSRRRAPRLMSTCGCCCSSRICGEFGCSSDRSFRYMRWIWNTGWSACRLGHGGLGVPNESRPAAVAGAAAPDYRAARTACRPRPAAAAGRRAGRARSGRRSRRHGCSPMKICGTVRRPVSSHHRARAAPGRGRRAPRRSPPRRAA